jgi:hypothetical protein
VLSRYSIDDQLTTPLHIQKKKKPTNQPTNKKKTTKKQHEKSKKLAQQKITPPTPSHAGIGASLDGSAGGGGGGGGGGGVWSERGRHAVESDPVLSRLTPSQLRTMLSATLRSVGAVRTRYLAVPAMRQVAPFLHSAEPLHRLAAVEAVHSLHGVADREEALRFLWMLLPLLWDQSVAVRAAVWRVLDGDEPLEVYRQRIIPHALGDRSGGGGGGEISAAAAEAPAQRPPLAEYNAANPNADGGPIRTISTELGELFAGLEKHSVVDTAKKRATATGVPFVDPLLPGETVPLAQHSFPPGWHNRGERVLTRPTVSSVAQSSLRETITKYVSLTETGVAAGAKTATPSGAGAGATGSGAGAGAGAGPAASSAASSASASAADADGYVFFHFFFFFFFSSFFFHWRF